LNTLSNPTLSIVIPSTGFIISDVNCPIKSFKIEETTTNRAKSPTGTCANPDLNDDCRTLKFDVSKVTSNGEIQYTYDITAKTAYKTFVKTIKINVNVTGSCGKEKLV